MADKKLSIKVADEQGGNYGANLNVDVDADDEDDFVPTHDSCLDKDKICRPIGFKLLCRALRCPCAKSRPLKAAKNPAELKTIALHLPVPPAKHYSRPDNTVTTAKYTPWDFIPAATALQFRRAVNVIYAFLILLMFVGWANPKIFDSPYTPFGTAGVLLFCIGVTLIMEGKDDLNRHRADIKTNAHPVTTIDFDTGKKSRAQWGQLVPGDIVQLHNLEQVPADIIILTTTQASGMCYIETSGIDGETNLKIRRAVPELKALYEKGVTKLTGILKCEEPNPFLSFNGSFEPSDGSHPISLAYENLLLRGSEIRNTSSVVGIVVYSGVETKLVLSKRATPSKMGTIDIATNRMVYGCCVQGLIMMFISLGVLQASTDTGELWYFKYVSLKNAYLLPGSLSILLSFLILYANVVAINMFVNVEIANFWQSQILLGGDLLMYDEVTDTPARCKTTSLISEIGQVSMVFSDKTGTLTQNVMRLVGCSLDGRRFGVKVPDANASGEASIDSEETQLGKRNVDLRQVFADLLQRIDSPTVAEFLLVLAVCHTVVIDTDDEGKPRYNAEGPDEEALVKAAAALGYSLQSTENNVYVVTDPKGRTHEYQILAINAFNSDRKRMSIVCRKKGDATALLLLKGADSVVAERAVNLSSQLQKDLDAFAQAGLRTLLVAKRTISESDLTSWQAEYLRAKATPGANRATELDRVAEKLEQRLDVIGATAIEDALQEGVPETIALMRKAGIKVWVLTGDKVDTAVNIGYSSKLLDPDMHQIVLDGVETHFLEAKIDEYLDVLNEVAKEVNPLADVKEQDWQGKTLALIITGKAVEFLLANQKGTLTSQAKLISLATICSVVLACRVSPAQKALIVRAASKGAKKRQGRMPVTLAIGDGANDVAMIQEARVGVGISGKEGLQAANSADFSIAQFRYLQRMLFIHGRWSYRRNAQLIMYVSLSWQVLTWPLFFFCFEAMFSGVQVYNQTLYVSLFAFISNFFIMVSAFFNKDINEKTIWEFPQCYDTGRLNMDLNVRTVVVMLVRSFVYGGIIYAVARSFFPAEGDFDLLGSSFMMCLVCTLHLYQMILVQEWNWVGFFGFFWIFTFYPLSVSLVDIWYNYYATMGTVDIPTSYASAILCVGTVALVEYGVEHIRRELLPDPMVVLMEYDRGYGDQSTKPFMHGAGDALSALGEGGKYVFVLPAEQLGKAFTKRFMRKTGAPSKQVAAAGGGADDLDVVVKVGGPAHGPLLAGVHRSGYAYGGPSE